MREVDERDTEREREAAGCGWMVKAMEAAGSTGAGVGEGARMGAGGGGPGGDSGRGGDSSPTTAGTGAPSATARMLRAAAKAGRTTGFVVQRWRGLGHLRTDGAGHRGGHQRRRNRRRMHGGWREDGRRRGGGCRLWMEVELCHLRSAAATRDFCPSPLQGVEEAAQL